jgi:antitoxin component YwqK of YwqJK toxin-antitoxin module
MQKTMKYALLCLIIFLQLPGVQAQAKKVLFEKLEDRNDIYFYQDKPFTGTSFIFHDNKKIWQEINWKDGQIHGFFQSFYESGSPELKVAYNQGTKDGPFISYYPNGKQSISCIYKNGVKNGLYRSFYISGMRKKECTYLNGKEHGPFILWFSNGQTEQIGEFVNGLPDGPIKSYTETGKVRKIVTYKNGYRHGKTTIYNVSIKNSSKDVQPTIAEELHYKDGYLDGVVKTYTTNNKLLSYTEYKQGKIHGRKTDFDFNGIKLKEEFYVEGKRNGLSVTWVEGVVSHRGQYVNGLKEGEWIENAHKESIMSSGSYVKGRKHGYWIIGPSKLFGKCEGSFYHGKKDKEWTYYDFKGKKISKETWDKGTLLEVKEIAD